MNQFVNRHKQDQIISELKVKEAEIIRQMQQSPKQFDPSKLIINIECQEPSNFAGGLNFNVQNQQSVSSSRRYAVSQAVIPSAPFIPEPNIPQHISMIPQAAQTTQGKFQNTSKY